MRAVSGAAAATLIAWFPFVAGRPVPLLDNADLGFHELGHLLAIAAPELIRFLAGSITQVAVPVSLALYFWLGRRDPVGSGVCLAWAGTSAHDVAVYIADAPVQRLPLIGGEHDWAYILGRFNALDGARHLAATVRGVGTILAVAGMLSCLAPLVAVPTRLRSTASR